MIAIINFFIVLNNGYIEKNSLTNVCELDYSYMSPRDMVSFSIGCTEVNRVRIYSDEKLWEIVSKYDRK